MMQHAYSDMHTYDPLTANFRYKFLPSDHRQLYRLYNRAQGIDVTRPVQYNIHDWLNPTSPNFRRETHDAIFYYAARVERDDRLRVCISTKDMDDAAWKYGHHGQIILDGTFGVCSSRMLLFIVMGIDNEGKGVPLALFLFSAPTGTRATHAGYNTAIIRELLQQWKNHLSKERPEPFMPCVAITDTDTKERGALVDVWPEIWLLLCKFHLRQCWTNKRKTLGLIPSAQKPDFWNEYVYGQLLSLEAQ